MCLASCSASVAPEQNSGNTATPSGLADESSAAADGAQASDDVDSPVASKANDDDGGGADAGADGHDANPNGAEDANADAESRGANSSDAGGANAGSDVNASGSETTPNVPEDALASAKPLEEPASTELYALLGITTGDKLIRLAKTSEDDAWIAAHPDAYEVFRPQIQQKCLRLAADEPQAAAFVRGLPDHVVADAQPNYEAPALFAGTPSPEVIDTSIPHLYQWDQRWGYTMYDGDAFGLSGCGPTAMAMIYQGLTGAYDRTPYDMGQLAFAGGFVSDSYGGTIYGYCGYAAAQLGLACEELELNAQSIVSALQSGRPMIANVGPGSFSEVGHYIVLAGITSWGKVVVNDPYSVERSSQLWDPELIASEAIVLYAFSTIQ